mmetsp:Transcript_18423/g.48618  ORF Transcript_18423/g.48618 Transcript_18423/m.48618 type:complete len:148 (-) Transcript_18423:152-595(-)
MMKAGEMKAELDMRGVSYVGCYDKTDLKELLLQSRAEGRADPAVIDEFNKQMLERKMSSEPEPELNLDEMDLDSMMAGDGSLPGGMTPDQVKKMASNPEMLKMMANPKLQEVMKAVMSGGPEAIAQFQDDAEAMEILQNLGKVMGQS